MITFFALRTRLHFCIYATELQIRGNIEDNSKTIFSYFSTKTYVVTLIKPSRGDGSIDKSQNMLFFMEKYG